MRICAECGHSEMQHLVDPPDRSSGYCRCWVLIPVANHTTWRCRCEQFVPL